ncbi:MAG: pyruvate kinase [Lawsonibacter sp.]
MTYQNLANRVEPGCHILVDDGLSGCFAGQRGERAGDAVKVENGGVLSNNKSINIPQRTLFICHAGALTEKDREDLRFAVEEPGL